MMAHTKVPVAHKQVLSGKIRRKHCHAVTKGKRL